MCGREGGDGGGIWRILGARPDRQGEERKRSEDEADVTAHTEAVQWFGAAAKVPAASRAKASPIPPLGLAGPSCYLPAA